MICGHSHKTVVYEPYENFDDEEKENVHYKNEAKFPVVLGSLRNDVNMKYETLFGYEFTGTAIEIKDGNYTISFTNSQHVVNETHTF